MPEYSSTTITPADSVKVPAMNGSTSGNFQLDALRNFILASKGQANGLASLGSDGKLPAAQLPDLADDVLVYANYATFPASGTAGKLYIAADTNKIYRWDDSLGTPAYVYLKVDWTDLTDGTVTVKKAECDASGNTITSTYETKADANDLKNALEDSEQRIENLEQAVSGSLVTTNTDATQKNTKSITSANTILPWAILKRVGARAVAWNQKCLKKAVGTYTNNGVTFTVDSDGVVTATWSTAPSANADCVIFNQNDTWGTSIANGSKVLIGYKPESASYQIRYAFFTAGGTSIVDTGITDASDSRIITLNDTATKAYIAVRVVAGATPTTVKFYPQIFDLTAMNEASLTADQFRAKFPASYYPYNAGGIIPLNPSGFKVVGKQKWDEQWESGRLSDISGNKTDGNGIRSKNYIQVSPSTTYYEKLGSYTGGTSMMICFYDADKVFISSVEKYGNSSFDTPSNCMYMRFAIFTSVAITAYNNDILICLNSVTDKSYAPYSDTTLDTSFTSDYKYVNPSCHDYSENVLVDGVKKREEHRIVGSVDLSEIAFSYDAGSSLYYKNNALSDAKLPSNSHDIAVMISDKYNPVSDYDVASSTEAISIGTTGQLCVKSSSTPSGKLYYALDAEPAPTLHDPIPNFPSEDGTTITAITPQTDLVNAIDVPSTIAYMTKIGG